MDTMGRSSSGYRVRQLTRNTRTRDGQPRAEGGLASMYGPEPLLAARPLQGACWVGAGRVGPGEASGTQKRQSSSSSSARSSCAGRSPGGTPAPPRAASGSRFRLIPTIAKRKPHPCFGFSHKGKTSGLSAAETWQRSICPSVEAPEAQAAKL